MVAAAVVVACDPVGVGDRVAYPANGSASPNPAVRNQPIHDLFIRVNRDRVANGMPKLVWSDQLGGLAASWSHKMAGDGVFGHRDLNAVLASARYAGWRTLGENILVGGCSLSGAAMEAAWMNSAGHRANILSAGYSRIGIGVECSSDGRAWATQEFGG